MMKHIKYLRYILRHKWWVFIAGLHAGVSLWKLIKHDWSKFLPSEWKPYANYFYGRTEEEEIDRIVKRAMKRGIQDSPMTRLLAAKDVKEQKQKHRFEFNKAWLQHINRNDHHWQYWILIRDYQEEQENIVKIIGREDQEHVGLVMLDKFGQWKLVGEVNTGGDDTALSQVVYRTNAIIPIEMDVMSIKEMAADWAGAGRAIQGKWDFIEFYKRNKDKIILAPLTRTLFETSLSIMDESIKKSEELQKQVKSFKLWRGSST